MNEINVGETYYILSRKRSVEKANYFLETILPGLPITVVANGFEDIIAAAISRQGVPSLLLTVLR
jgi:hypothetical protein